MWKSIDLSTPHHARYLDSACRQKLVTLVMALLLIPVSLFPQAPAIRNWPTGGGPEDMVLDSVHIPPRLLISCSSRREGDPAYGEIESIDPATGSRSVMMRVGEPAGLVFRPHGLSLVGSGELSYLYVITHDDSQGIHPVIQYMVDGDSLIFVRTLDSRLLVSPNALQAYPDGSLFVCNDAGSRGSMKEKIFRQKKGNILFYDGRGNWTIAARELGMPAGLTGLGNRIFVSAALENCLYSFRVDDGQLIDKQIVCKIKGPDNIRIHNGNLITTSHSKPLKFIRHVKDKSNHSPSMVLSVDPQTGRPARLFYDDGRLISAASVAIVLNDQLFIGQIFEPFISVTKF
jgi:hypothetical protein